MVSADVMRAAARSTSALQRRGVSSASIHVSGHMIQGNRCWIDWMVRRLIVSVNVWNQGSAQCIAHRGRPDEPCVESVHSRVACTGRVQARGIGS